jgi:hypothetical protein
MRKQIEELTDEDLMALWPAIGGAPHLFEYGKDELKNVLISGSYDEADLQLDFGKKELPEYSRLPTAEELDEMRVWAINYRRTTKSSKRQTRIATQEHFKIRIIK